MEITAKGDGPMNLEANQIEAEIEIEDNFETAFTTEEIICIVLYVICWVWLLGW